MENEETEQPPNGEQTEGGGLFESLERKLTPFGALILGAVLFQLLVFAYFPSIHGAFLYDDIEAIVENPDLRHPGEPWRLLRDHEGSIQFDRRPVTGLVTLIDFQLWKLRPFGYRITNLLLHALTGAALAVLLHGVARKFRCPCPRLFSAAVVGLWAVHPLATDAVAFIFQRAEILMSLFAVLSLLCLERAHRNQGRRWHLGALVCTAFSALSKETGLVLIVVLPLFDRIVLAASWRELFVRRKWFYVGLVLVIAGVTTWVSTGIRMGERSAEGLAISEPLNYFKLQCSVIRDYLRMVVWPHPINFAPAAPPGVPTTWIPAFVQLSVGVIAVGLAGFKRRWLWLALGVFLAVLAPTSSFYPVPFEPEAAFRMYLPSACVLAMLVAGLGAGVARKPRWQASCVLLVLVCMIALTGAARVRSAIFRSPVALWTDVLKQEPENPKACLNLAMAHLNTGNTEEAYTLGLHMKNLALRPGSSRHVFLSSQRILALAEMEAGAFEPALSRLNAIAKESPEMRNLDLDLATVRLRSGDSEGAWEILGPRTASMDAGNLPWRLLLIEYYLRIDKPREAGRYMDELSPQIPREALESQMAQRLESGAGGAHRKDKAGPDIAPSWHVVPSSDALHSSGSE